MLTTLHADRPAWLDPRAFPFDVRRLDLEGRRIGYIDEGTGPVILFLHAGPAWSFIFRDLILELRENFRCIALDLPGTGLSAAEDAPPLDLTAAARFVEGFIRALDLDGFDLLVHDLGGPIGLDAARRLPGRVRGLILTDTFAWPLDGVPAVAGMLRLVGGPLFRAINSAFALLPRATATRGGIGRHLTQRDRRVFLGPFTHRSARRASLPLFRQAARRTAALAEIRDALAGPLGRRPALLIYGERDPARRAGFQRRFEEILPHARSVTVPGARHFPHTDAPGDVADLIRSWWPGSPPATALPDPRDPG